ncbi:MAG: ribosomal protein S18-alanine N-acetyltransferase [Candidatus Bipolaricaulota bacterium]|nr:ribosomal protein S18-alanine N-acetyltransferase [Candidatus Bipolaricaulota bacterium]MDW8152089.1 ribosomal protein S18-alanine N-acetyltransferase [Candidatus Bipolaricaulota bacterium]
MRVRRAGLRDLPGIHRVEQASFPDPWPLFAFLPYLLDREALALVAEEDGVLGFLLARREGEEVHIHDLAVAPAHRRRGVGSALLGELFRAARGARRVRLEVRASNRTAQAFYKKHGFREEAVLPGYYADGEDGLLMVRDLP